MWLVSTAATSAKLTIVKSAVNAYGIVGQLTFPLLNKSLQTQSTTANLQMSITQSCNWRDHMIEDLVAMGFNIELEHRASACRLLVWWPSVCPIVRAPQTAIDCGDSLESWGVDTQWCRNWVQRLATPRSGFSQQVKRRNAKACKIIFGRRLQLKLLDIDEWLGDELLISLLV